MTIPAGIETRTLTISSGTGIEGHAASLEVVVSPSVDSVVWLATSEPLLSFFSIVRTPPETAAVLHFPVVDQSGFVDKNQDPITDWYYKITVRYLKDGRKVGLQTVKYFKPIGSDPLVVDFDNIPSGDVPIYRGPTGPQGKSAYELAVAGGFTGSVSQWLASLASGGHPVSYEHIQSSPSEEWTIQHNLGFFPGGVMLVDSANREFKAEIVQINENTLRVSMIGAQSGTAYIS